MPNGGPFTVYSQPRITLLAKGDDRCPRRAFLENLQQAIKKAQQEGDWVAVMLDGNDLMTEGSVFQMLTESNKRESIIEKQGILTWSTVTNNESDCPTF